MEAKTSIEATLAECEAQIDRNQMSIAEEALMELIRYGSRDDLERLRDTVMAIIGRFYPQRRKRLGVAFSDRLTGGVSRQDDTRVEEDPKEPIEVLRHKFEREVSSILQDLSDVHIFQWSTYYRDGLQKIIARALDFIQSTSGQGSPYEWIGEQFYLHSQEIFSKGYRYTRTLKYGSADLSASKSLAGLRSFLALPVEIYADQSSSLSEPRDCRTLRQVTSKMLAGILSGYASANFEHTDPVPVLTRTIKSWAHVLPLLTQGEVEVVSERLGLAKASAILGEPLALLATAIDETSIKSSVDPIVIVSATVNLDEQIIDVALRPPVDSSDTKPLEIAVLNSSASLQREQIAQRIKRGYIACLTMLKHDELWADTVAPKEAGAIVTSIADSVDSFRSVLLERIRLRFYEKAIVPGPDTVLRTNIAERFPLENPTILAFFRVQRPSIRALDKMLSTRTGVMLWCSVRRSGKTTGVSELATSVEDRQIVLQRCEASGIDPTSRILFEALRRALGSRVPLAPNFIRRHVLEALPMGAAEAQRTVLIVDEYDRLFGTLRAAGRGDEDLRHLVIQPFLDQLVEFATDNLVVLLGQHPNAHYIFMDQNQLSAYVQQQPYPLFVHPPGAAYGELWDLLTKVFQHTLRFDPTFADAIHREAGGHPFLTVNLLRDFVDWLVKRKVVPAKFILTGEIFEEYASVKLSRKAIASSAHYEFFRAASGEALSRDGIKDSPWLYAVYFVLRQLVRNGGESLCVSRDDVCAELVDVLGETGLTTYSPESFLTSADSSNFVTVDESTVRPRIPLLARIAASRG